MNIDTYLVKSKQCSPPIQPGLLKHSQEYRVLVTLRYLFPQKYNKMVTGESPDLQDHESDIGIEVTAAVRENDMKAEKAFSKLHQTSKSTEVEKCESTIKSCDYSLVPIPGEKLAISTTGTSNGEKVVFQKSIRKKREKLQQYRNKFKVLGLAIVLHDPPTTEAETCIVDWIREVFQEDNNRVDFVYVFSHRFCIYYEVQKDYSQKWNISSEENNLLLTIAKMTAEGELSLDDQEWR